MEAVREHERADRRLRAGAARRGPRPAGLRPAARPRADRPGLLRDRGHPRPRRLRDPRPPRRRRPRRPPLRPDPHGPPRRRRHRPRQLRRLHDAARRSTAWSTASKTPAASSASTDAVERLSGSTRSLARLVDRQHLRFRRLALAALGDGRVVGAGGEAFADRDRPLAVVLAAVACRAACSGRSFRGSSFTVRLPQAALSSAMSSLPWKAGNLRLTTIFVEFLPALAARAGDAAAARQNQATATSRDAASQSKLRHRTL